MDFLPAAAKELQKLEALGFGGLPVCIAKTQYSFSDNPALLGRPAGFRITVKSIRLSAGAGFVVVLTGDIMTMPGPGRAFRRPRISTWTKTAGFPACSEPGCPRASLL